MSTSLIDIILEVVGAIALLAVVAVLGDKFNAGTSLAGFMSKAAPELPKQP